VKTPDAKWFGIDAADGGAGTGAAGSSAGNGGLAAAIEPSYAAFSRAGVAA
jgi:hypothetical protein